MTSGQEGVYDLLVLTPGGDFGFCVPISFVVVLKVGGMSRWCRRLSTSHV